MKWFGLGRRATPEEPFFDCHTHLLPGLDDGASTWEEAEELIAAAYQAGTRAVVLTPHYMVGSYEPSPDEIKAAAEELARRLEGVVPVTLGTGRSASAARAETAAADAPDPSRTADAGGGVGPSEVACASDTAGGEAAGPDPRLRLLVGAEAYLDPALPELVGRGKILTLGDLGTHLLVELPLAEVPRWADEVLFSLALAGVTPVLAHPERCAGVRRRLEWLAAAVERGALVQVNGGSLTGAYGGEVARAAAGLVRRGLVHFLGSDAHGPDRPALLAGAVVRAERIAGAGTARRLAWQNAAALFGL